MASSARPLCSDRRNRAWSTSASEWRGPVGRQDETPADHPQQAEHGGVDGVQQPGWIRHAALSLGRTVVAASGEIIAR